jgi:hypothetical protein
MDSGGILKKPSLLTTLYSAFGEEIASQFSAD